MMSRSLILLTAASIAFLAVFFIFPEITSAQVLINEIFSDPSGSGDTGKEWIELYNSSDQTAELGGWQINGSGKYFTLPSFSLAPDSYLLIHWRADGQNTVNEIFTGSAAMDINLGNSSGFIAIFKSAEHNKDTIVDYIEYGKAGQTLEATAASAEIWQRGQFLPAPAENQTLRLKKDGQDTNSVSDWEIYNLPPESPNTNTHDNTNPQQENQTENNQSSENQISQTEDIQSTFNNFSDKILINEFMPSPPTGGKEWVELTNTGLETINLSSWQIDDGAEGSQAQIIVQGTIIQPGQFLVIELEKNILNNEGDQVRLIWPDGQVLHTVSYQNAKPDLSSSRFENGLWLWTENATPGQENKKPAQKSTSAPKTESPNPQNIPPLVVAVSEAVSAQKNETGNNKSVAVEEINLTQQPNLTQNIGVSESLPMEAAAAKKQIFSPFLALAAISILSFFCGLGIVYFKRKSSVDSN